MTKYNILAKCLKGQEYIITDMIATKLTKQKFAKLQELNDFLQDYRFIEYKDTDFTWWDKITKYLTINKLYKNCNFDIDYYGNITRY